MQQQRFAGKVAWVTGGSSGIGEALVAALAGEGASVIVSGRRIAALEAVAAAVDGDTLILPFEATAYDELEGVVQRALGWHGRVDLLVNNAGVSQRSLALDTDFSVYRQLMEVDYFAPLRLTQHVLPHMVRRGSGHIAVVSSLAGKLGVPLRSGYCGAKHACVGYFEALRAEVEQAYGISVSTILPGSVQTGVAVNALSADGSPRGRTDANIAAGMTAQDAARIIVDGLAGKEREIVVAQGDELAALEVRRRDPEAFFAFVAGEGARLAVHRQAFGVTGSPDPSKVTLDSAVGRD